MTLPCTPHLRCCCGLRGNVAKLRLTSPTDLQHCTNGVPVIHLPARSSSSILEGGHPARILLKSHGVWRSLVARFVRDEEAVGSNPATPTRVESQDTVQQGPGTFHIRFFLIFPPGINPPVGSLHLPIAPAPPPTPETSINGTRHLATRTRIISHAVNARPTTRIWPRGRASSRWRHLLHPLWRYLFHALCSTSLL